MAQITGNENVTKTTQVPLQQRQNVHHHRRTEQNNASQPERTNQAQNRRNASAEPPLHRTDRRINILV